MSLLEIEVRKGQKSTKRIPHMNTGRPDDFQTPASALDCLLPFLPAFSRIWEPACGRGNLVRALCGYDFEVVGTDILTGTDFLTCHVPDCDLLLTNPPYSIKNEWIARCYAIGKPFALLMPLTALETQTRQKLYSRHGLEMVFPSGRVNFETPSGRGSGSWFYAAWFTWGLNIGRAMTFAIDEPQGNLFEEVTR